MQASESLETRMIDSALRAWRSNADRIDKFIGALSSEQLEQEIAPGRNRLIYRWGHIVALNDRLFRLMGLGPRLYPEMDVMFSMSNQHGFVSTDHCDRDLYTSSQTGERVVNAADESSYLAGIDLPVDGGLTAV
jgi:hypothetical protein